MKQELQYLREELNQRVCTNYEHVNKTINTVLLIWGGTLAILGTFKVNFKEINHEGLLLFFLEATIFFISNVILYLAARKYHAAMDNVFRIAAYILVFYERRPSNTVIVGKNFSWEIAHLEIEFNDIKNGTKRKKSFYKKNDEYKVLILISLVLITIFSVLIFSEVFYFSVTTIGIIHIMLSLICVLYITFSLYFFLIIPKYTSSMDNLGMRARHLNAFFQYALDTGHYTPEKIQERFGDFYEKCKKYRT